MRATQSKQAYGEWEFDIYKGADGNDSRVGLLCKTPTSTIIGAYMIIIGNTETLELLKEGVSIMKTASSYISNNTWYRIKVARLKSSGTFSSIVPSMTTVYPANTFAVFIKGGSFGNNYKLVSTAGGSGSNPVTDSTHTTSEFFVADLDAGDKIANIKLSLS